MTTLLIIADDFTGALDTAVQFASVGVSVKVVVGIGYEFENTEEDIQVLVMDAETRHCDAIEAYDIVWNITKKAIDHHILFIYKKTDSALRGNIGSELSALLNASENKILPFLPAFPKIGRITRKGIHYINDIPVNESVFGKDPFEPVAFSFIPDIIHQQTQFPVKVMTQNGYLTEDISGFHGIAVYDAQTQNQLKETALHLYHNNQLSVMAGCAGFASVLPELLGLCGESRKSFDFPERLLVVCGSVNPITKKQLDYAERHGFVRLRLTPEQKLNKTYWENDDGKTFLKKWIVQSQINPKIIIDSNDEDGGTSTFRYAETHGISLGDVRIRIADVLGFVLKKILESGIEHTLLITGGDTLLGFMNQIRVCEIKPISEIQPGIVLSHLKIFGKTWNVISKSGGFGSEDLLVQLTDKALYKEENIL